MAKHSKSKRGRGRPRKYPLPTSHVPAAEPAATPNTHDSDFAKLIADSKEKVASESQDRDPKRRGPIRPVGRPRMDAPAPKVAEPVEPEAPKGEPTPDVTEFLVAPIQMLSSYPASKYKIPELAFNQDESKAVAASINGLIQAFFPTVDISDPKSAAVAGAVLTCGALALAKVQIYLAEMNRRAEERKQAEPPKEEMVPPVGPITGTVGATDFFRRETML